MCNMAPVISNLTHDEERLILSCLQRHRPNIRVDMLEASAAVKEGENFMSVVSKVIANGHDLESGEKVKLSLIMKNIPESEERRQLFRCDAFSRNEAAFYSRILPCMELVSKMPFPSCLHASDDCLILKHLGPDGFVMVDRKKGLDLQHCEVVLQELGRFHAVSLALKHLEPEQFTNIRTAVKEVHVSKSNLILDACVDNCVDMALAVFNGKDSTAINKLKGIRGRGFEVLAPLVDPKEPLAVICHGDLWSNNILFRYGPHHEIPSDVCFLDLQGSRYASPALDILYFLFSSSQPGVTRHHFRHLIKTYHCALTEHLYELSPHAPIVSLEDIMTELRHYGLFGLVMSIMVLPVVTADEIIVSLDNITEDSLQSQEFREEAQNGFLTPEFNKRVNENFEIFSSEGLI